MKKTIYTIGHSTRQIEEFISLLNKFEIRLLVDIRKIAKSRHNPQYWENELKESLRAASIEYERLEGLGGFRRANTSEQNNGWHNKSFRSYADYMQTEEFSKSLDELIKMTDKKTVIMCAEAVPWRCHRSLVADALTVRGIDVIDIISANSHPVHKLTSFARAEGNSITYPQISS